MLKLLRVGRANHASSRSTCGPEKAQHVNRVADLVAGAAGNGCPLAESALGHVPGLVRDERYRTREAIELLDRAGVTALNTTAGRVRARSRPLVSR